MVAATISRVRSAIWRVWAAATPLRPAEPASTEPALRHVEPPPRPPASPETRRDAPERPAHAPESAISWRQPSRVLRVFRTGGARAPRWRLTPRPRTLRQVDEHELRSGDAVFRCDDDLRIAEWNEGAEKLTGVAA